MASVSAAMIPEVVLAVIDLVNQVRRRRGLDELDEAQQTEVVDMAVDESEARWGVARDDARAAIDEWRARHGVS